MATFRNPMQEMHLQQLQQIHDSAQTNANQEPSNAARSSTEPAAAINYTSPTKPPVLERLTTAPAAIGGGNSSRKGSDLEDSFDVNASPSRLMSNHKRSLDELAEDDSVMGDFAQHQRARQVTLTEIDMINDSLEQVNNFAKRKGEKQPSVLMFEINADGGSYYKERTLRELLQYVNEEAEKIDMAADIRITQFAKHLANISGTVHSGTVSGLHVSGAAGTPTTGAVNVGAGTNGASAGSGSNSSNGTVNSPTGGTGGSINNSSSQQSATAVASRGGIGIKKSISSNSVGMFGGNGADASLPVAANVISSSGNVAGQGLPPKAPARSNFITYDGGSGGGGSGGGAGGTGGSGDGSDGTTSGDPVIYNVIGELRLRDLRRLDFQFNPNEERSVLIRRHAVLFAMDPMRAVVMATKLILIVPEKAEALVDILERYMKEWVTAKEAFEQLASARDQLAPHHQQQLASISSDLRELPFEMHAYEALLTTVIALETQEFNKVNVQVQGVLKVFRSGSLLPIAIQEQMRNKKNNLSNLMTRIESLRENLTELTEDDEDMALMNLSVLKYKPKLYHYPLVPEILTKHDEMEELLESYLIDLGALESKIDFTRSQIQSAEELVSLRLDTSRNELLIANTALAILGCCFGLGAYITGIFGMNLDNTDTIQNIPHLFESVIAVCSVCMLGLFFFIVFVFRRSGMFPYRFGDIFFSKDSSIAMRQNHQHQHGNQHNLSRGHSSRHHFYKPDSRDSYDNYNNDNDGAAGELGNSHMNSSHSNHNSNSSIGRNNKSASELSAVTTAAAAAAASGKGSFYSMHSQHSIASHSDHEGKTP
eukprot:CAMPEP_0174982286 /NCGR_PEP_ID=MMETSP0004_2-20121128/16409_1 /TAXON_ID=420556 /ORGANISM="Ochromonas sp., Strain CCMP1393" /LENGTH=824 /DNA_ID=CAMNT_0016234221 /DNA_START=61 /DNA_END=2535 /DNA_ORIENTATION=+